MCLVPDDHAIVANAMLIDTSKIINVSNFIEQFHRCPPMFLLKATVDIDATEKNIAVIVDYGDINDSSMIQCSQEMEEQEQDDYDTNGNDGDYETGNNNNNNNGDSPVY